MKTAKKTIIKSKRKPAKMSKDMLAKNRAFRIARCRMGEPVITVELTDSILTDLFQVAKEEWDLIWLSSGKRQTKNIETFKRIWIERYFNALCLETLSRIRGKFSGNLPIPDAHIQLNSENLRIDAGNEIQNLRNMLYETIARKTGKSYIPEFE